MSFHRRYALRGFFGDSGGDSSGEELYNAEEYSFGVSDSDIEYAITTTSAALSRSNNGNSYSCGWKFNVLSAFSVKGFRMMNSDYSSNTDFTIRLYRVSDSKLIASAIVHCEKSATADVFLDIPVNLSVGETYAIYVPNNYWLYRHKSNVTFNSKIACVSGICTSSYTLSDILANENDNVSGFVFPIMGAPIGVDTPTEFKVQLDTMNAITNEVQRITGATGKMNTAQIITALESIAVQTTE